ncbi:MAG: pantoate--beta-alanine ligase [Acidimicrobiales bacterium]|jgi:pantoate--beta-alanine ligase
MTTTAPLPTPLAPATPVRTDCQVLAGIAGCARLLDDARGAGLTVALVPTMGALHAGHRSLIERAAAECDLVVVSIFVNPLQFGEPDDIEQYPRTLDADVALAAAAGARLVFAPPVREMYPGFPEPVPTTVSVSGVGDRWEGASRPGHFDGVATVVAKLFSMAGRCRAYFGEKDFQQLAVVRRMVADLSLPVEVVGCATVRDPDGLALSSRNVRLAPDERRAALALSRALRAGAEAMALGEHRTEAIERCMASVVAAEPLVELDYAVAVRADDLQRARSVRRGSGVRLLIAARVGRVRLIDNLDPDRPPKGSS